MNDILQIENFSISYTSKPQKRIVDNVSLFLRQGSWTSVVGRSGSGKSSLALALGRLIPAQRLQGSARYFKDGHSTDLAQISPPVLRSMLGREIAYIFQDPGSSLDPVMRVGRQIIEAYETHFGPSNESRKKAMELLEKVKIRDTERVFNSYPHQISGGMKQRVMIAMALVAQPSLLIADEPTTALDSENERETLQLLSDLKKARLMTIFFITHNLRIAMERSDVIYVMEDGKLVERLEKGSAFSAVHEASRRLLAADFSGLKSKEMIPI